MADCRVFRRANTRAGMWVPNGQPRFPREWVGVCGECGEHVRGAPRYGDGQATRKSVRDALYHHGRTKHAGRA